MASPPDLPSAPGAQRAPRKMRLPRWIVLVVVALAFLIGAGWWSQRPLARVTLPDGGELILIDAQYGPQYRHVHRIGLKERLRHLLSSRRGSPLPRPYDMHVGNPSDSPRLWLVFEKRGTEMENASFGTMEAGQTLESPKFTFSGPLLIGEFKCYPRRLRQFELKISMGERGRQTITATIPNPFPVFDVPRWTPEPIPQTRRLKSREIILKSLRELPIGSFQISPEIEVHEAGVPSDAFNIRHMLSDATGNVSWNHLPWSEPAWKIHVTVTPNGHYPFPASEYLSLGHTTMPGPGEYRLLKLPADPRVDAVGGHALFTGPGWYRIHFGEEPIVEPVQQPTAGTSGLAADGSQIFQSRSEGVLILGKGTYRRESPDCRHIMRAVVGSANIPFAGWGWGEDFNRIPRESFELSSPDASNAPPAGTEMELQLLLPSEESVDFFVRPPS